MSAPPPFCGLWYLSEAGCCRRRGGGTSHFVGARCDTATRRYTGSSGRLLRTDVVLEIAGGGGSAADRTGTGGVPDLGQVAELDAVSAGFAGFVPAGADAGGMHHIRSGY